MSIVIKNSFKLLPKMEIDVAEKLIFYNATYGGIR